MESEESFKPRSLPPYREMIMEAVTGLNAKNGSNKTSIVRFIESKYGDLPFALSLLISHHLKRMKETRELVFWKNNYLLPGPNVPPRGCGRGRPPKPKPSSPLSTNGCPQEDMHAPSEPQTRDRRNNGSGRPRGRSPKMAKPMGGVTGGSDTTAETAKTGMPLKPKPEPLSSEELNTSSINGCLPMPRKQDCITTGSRRPRGRPPKKAKLMKRDCKTLGSGRAKGEAT